MATSSNHPFIPTTNDTWQKVLDAAVTGFPGQDYKNVLDTQKIDSSTAIQPWQIVTNIGAIWGNTVDTFMRVAWPAIVHVLGGGAGTGDFVGPNGSTQFGIVRYANTTGKLGLDSAITVTGLTGNVMELPAGGSVRTQGAGSILSGSGGALGPTIGTTGQDDTAYVALFTSGVAATSASSRFHTGNRDPVGNVTGQPGDYYLRASTTTSAMYVHRGASSNNTDWVDFSQIVGGGDFFGPASSTANAIVRFANTTGKLGADSGITIDGSDVMTLPTGARLQLEGTTFLAGDTNADGPIVGHAGTDVFPAIQLRSTAGGATSGVFRRTTTPVGAATGNPGDLCIQSSGSSSTLWIHTGASADNTSWSEIQTASGATQLNELSDVTITSPVEGQVLAYNTAGTDMVNSGIPTQYILTVPGDVKTGSGLEHHNIYTFGKRFEPLEIAVHVKGVDSSGIEVQVTANGSNMLTTNLAVPASQEFSSSTSITPGMTALAKNTKFSVNVPVGTDWTNMTVHIRGRHYVAF